MGGEDYEERVFGPETGDDDEIPNTAYEELAGAFRLAYYGIPDHVLELDAGHTRQLDAPRPGGYFANSGKPERRYRFYDPQELSYVHLRDRWSIGSDLVEHLQTTIWWHQFHEDHFRSKILDFGTADERIRTRNFTDTLNAYGIDLQATTLLGSEEQHEVTWGGTAIYETTEDSYRELQTPKGSTDPASLSPYNPSDWPNKTAAPDNSDYTTLGLFVQDDWQITHDVSLLTGIRYSRYDWSFGDVDGDADDITGSVRGIWDVTDHHHVFAGVSKGFRAPNLKNLGGAVDRGSSGNAAQGNPGLEPELSYTYEAGWKWGKGRDSLAFTVFKTDIEDLIQRDFAGTGEFTNVEGADLWGFETAWDYGVYLDEMNRVALVGSMSLVDATRDIPVAAGGTFEDNISRASRLYGRCGIEYEHGRNWWGLLQVRWHDEYDEVATHPSNADADDIRLTVPGDPDGSMPGYGVVDIKAGWESDDGKYRIGLFVENIADKTYRTPGSGTDGVGRNFGINAGFRF